MRMTCLVALVAALAGCAPARQNPSYEVVNAETTKPISTIRHIARLPDGEDVWEIETDKATCYLAEQDTVSIVCDWKGSRAP